MRIGIFADLHDHLDNARRTVAIFNDLGCDLVLFAGDFVSTFVTPPLRRLRCRLLGVFGDSDGNLRGLRNGLATIGDVCNGPIGLRTTDGTRLLLTHMLRDLRGLADDCDVVIYSHTHKPVIRRDDKGRLLISPGEASGWTYRRPTIACLETPSLNAWLIPLPELPPPPPLVVAPAGNI